MKLAMTILTCLLAAGVATAQNPDIIRNTKALMNGVQSNATRATNQALGMSRPAASKGVAPAHGSSLAPAVRLGPEKAPVASRMAGARKTARPVPVKHTAPMTKAKVRPAVATSKPRAGQPHASGNAETAKNADQKEQKWALTGKRDPFVSPVVYQTGPSSCASGKKCLEIGAINLRGVVHSDNGFIAVVTNHLNKAYFLRENDPVFNGYVVKITGDSIVFQETMQDRLGKTFTKEVVKKLTTPAV
jgi:hypothetical protein